MAQDNDKNTVARLATIADALETRLGVAPQDALRRDFTIAAQLRRIENAIPQIASLSNVSNSTSGRTLSLVIQDPENVKTYAGRSTKSFLVWLNGTGTTFQITRVRAASDADDYTFSLFRSASFADASTGTDTLLGTFACAANGTSIFTVDASSFASNLVPNGAWIIFEHVSGSAETLSILIEGILQ